MEKKAQHSDPHFALTEEGFCDVTHAPLLPFHLSTITDRAGWSAAAVWGLVQAVAPKEAAQSAEAERVAPLSSAMADRRVCFPQQAMPRAGLALDNFATMHAALRPAAAHAPRELDDELLTAARGTIAVQEIDGVASPTTALRSITGMLGGRTTDSALIPKFVLSSSASYADGTAAYAFTVCRTWQNIVDAVSLLHTIHPAILFPSCGVADAVEERCAKVRLVAATFQRHSAVFCRSPGALLLLAEEDALRYDTAINALRQWHFFRDVEERAIMSAPTPSRSNATLRVFSSIMSIGRHKKGSSKATSAASALTAVDAKGQDAVFDIVKTFVPLAKRRAEEAQQLAGVCVAAAAAIAAAGEALLEEEVALRELVPAIESLAQPAPSWMADQADGDVADAVVDCASRFHAIADHRCADLSRTLVLPMVDRGTEMALEATDRAAYTQNHVDVAMALVSRAAAAKCVDDSPAEVARAAAAQTFLSRHCRALLADGDLMEAELLSGRRERQMRLRDVCVLYVSLSRQFGDGVVKALTALGRAKPRLSSPRTEHTPAAADAAHDSGMPRAAVDAAAADERDDVGSPEPRAESPAAPYDGIGSPVVPDYRSSAPSNGTQDAPAE
jgi:hypothetical protein